MEEVIEYLQDNPLIAVRGFKHAGILSVFSDDTDLKMNLRSLLRMRLTRMKLLMRMISGRKC